VQGDIEEDGENVRSGVMTSISTAPLERLGLGLQKMREGAVTEGHTPAVGFLTAESWTGQRFDVQVRGSNLDIATPGSQSGF
jgi:hypothetical protein